MFNANQLQELRRVNNITPGDTQTHLFRYLDSTHRSIGDLINELIDTIESK